MASPQVVTTQSRHIPLRSAYTTVNQPAKKDGAGGAFTWGGAADVTDYASIGAQRAPTVTTLPAAGLTSSMTIPAGNAIQGTTQYVSTSQAASTPLNVSSYAQFPAFGIGSSPAPATWGPTTKVVSTTASNPVRTISGASTRGGYTLQSPTAAGWTVVDSNSTTVTSGVVTSTPVAKAPEAEVKKEDADSEEKEGEAKDPKECSIM